MVLLELENIGYQIAGQTVLQQINLQVATQDYITITGPSGSGKSTLLRIIAGLLTRTSGQLLFAGKEWADYDPILYRRQVSYAVQQPQLFGTTVADNLRFPFQIRQQAFDSAQATAALTSVNLPADYLNKPVNDLSGGERQRVAILRNLLFPPQVLLLDEISTGLDDENKQILHREIRRMNQEKNVTILAVTHDNTEIKDANRLVKIVAGKMEVDQ
ncbi:ABC transporter ATP-binding protein [Loigolactobacillus jiayinensis]|uniref:ATP-binding cassette domain-containing protein n=1 Tax=Loigolactobacillus jiayinensis TaxID=2486016 RepID=A0ABW1RCZ6_9LACO|nr:ATP-binding cassette domain-containing protein [Loigolactobacillus jiayinensis]